MKTIDFEKLYPAGGLYHGVDDDLYYKDTTRWTTTATDSGAATAADAACGVVALVPSDGTVADNDEIYLLLSKETFLFADDKPIIAECRLKWTEANTDDANVAFGLMDAVGADSILDNGGGPKASYSGAVFFKIDGETVWQVENSLGSTQKTTKLDAAGSITKDAITASGGSYQTLRIEWRPKTSTKADVLFFVDDVLVAKHVDQVYTSATEMTLFVGAKNGSANNESISVDRILAVQKR